MSIKQMSNKCVPESARTRKMREKLQQHWSELDRRINPDALKAMVEEIHCWISRHAYQRVSLRDKNISLFDENQNVAKTSHKVAQLAQRLRSELQKPEDEFSQKSQSRSL